MNCSRCGHLTSGKYCSECGTAITRNGSSDGIGMAINGSVSPESVTLVPFESDFFTSSNPNCFRADQVTYGSYDMATSFPQSQTPLNVSFPHAQDAVVHLNPDDSLAQGRFVIRRMLGKGGCGSVYLADDTLLDQQIALKVVFAKHGQAQLATDQLVHEFKVCKSLHGHPHILQVELPLKTEFGGDEVILLPMEYCSGGSLRNWIVRHQSQLRNWNQAPEEVKNQSLDLFRQACEGVKALHKAGLLHLDLKPENLLIHNGQVKVADFGLSRLACGKGSASPLLLRHGLGTPAYMAPEQIVSARLKDLTAAADIYALGVILFEILDGDQLFDGNNKEITQKHLQFSPPALKNAPTHLTILVQSCLAKDVGLRPETVAELMSAVDSKDFTEVIQQIETAISQEQWEVAGQTLKQAASEGLSEIALDSLQKLLVEKKDEEKRRKQKEARRKKLREKKLREAQEHNRRLEQVYLTTESQKHWTDIINESNAGKNAKLTYGNKKNRFYTDIPYVAIFIILLLVIIIVTGVISVSEVIDIIKPAILSLPIFTH